MEPFRFLHTADLHLGTPFKGVSSRLPEMWERRVRSAADGVFERIAAIAIRERVQFVTIAGDLFDSDTASMAAHFALQTGFKQLQQAGIEVVISHGNHDPLRTKPPINWPDNVHVLSPLATETGRPVDSVQLTLAGGTQIQVAGFSYPQAELRQSVYQAYERQSSADIAIALLHGAVGPTADHANYAPATIQELSTRGFDIWALGHIHQPAILQEAQPLIFYPGNPQGRHPNEQGSRGVRLVDVTSSGHISTSFIPTAAIVWQTCEVSLTGVDSMNGCVTAVSNALDNILTGGHPPAIMRCVLTGETELHADLAGDDELVSDLMQEVMARHPDVWIERCSVATKPAVDLAVLAESHEFIGELLRTADYYRNQPAILRETFGPMLADIFHKGNELSLEAISDGELLLWLDEAVAQCLQFAGEGQGA